MILAIADASRARGPPDRRAGKGGAAPGELGPSRSEPGADRPEPAGVPAAVGRAAEGSARRARAATPQTLMVVSASGVRTLGTPQSFEVKPVNNVPQGTNFTEVAAFQEAGLGPSSSHRRGGGEHQPRPRRAASHARGAARDAEGGPGAVRPDRRGECDARRTDAAAVSAIPRVSG